MPEIRVVIASILTLVLLFYPVTTTAANEDAENSGEPVPYDPEEFPRALRGLRRFEIVALGSVPLTLLFSSLGYRLYRVSTEDGLTWQDSGNFTVDQRRRVLTIGLSVSAGVGVLDFVLGRIGDDSD